MELVQTAIELLISVSLAATIFAYSTHASKKDFLWFRSEQRLLLISLLSIFALTPMVAIAVIFWIDPPLVVRVAIASMSVSIIPPLLPWKQIQNEGGRHYAIGLTLIVAILAIGVVPASVDLLGKVSHHPYDVAPGEIAQYVFVIVVLPTMLGMAFACRWKDLAERISIPLAKIAGIGTLIAICIVLLSAIGDMPEVIGTRTILAMLAFNLIALGIGHLLGGPDPDRAVVLGLTSASRHPAVAISIASVAFPGEKFTAAVMLCVAINMAITTVYLRWQSRKFDQRNRQTDPDTIAR